MFWGPNLEGTSEKTFGQVVLTDHLSPGQVQWALVVSRSVISIVSVSRRDLPAPKHRQYKLYKNRSFISKSRISKKSSSRPEFQCPDPQNTPLTSIKTKKSKIFVNIFQLFMSTFTLTITSPLSRWQIGAASLISLISWAQLSDLRRYSSNCVQLQLRETANSSLTSMGGIDVIERSLNC